MQRNVLNQQNDNDFRKGITVKIPPKKGNNDLREI